MKFHVLGLGHTKTNEDFVLCAYTMKIWNFCRMMKDLGHVVYHYGNEGSNPVCDKQIDILSNEEFGNVYGDNDHSKNFFRFDKEDLGWSSFVKKAEEKLRENIEDPKSEFIIVFFGNYYDNIAKANLGIFVEGGVGYTGHFSKWKVFESYFWQAVNFGQYQTANGWGDWYSVVIPNYIDPEMFEYSDKKEDYFLYIGRIIPSKGIAIITQIADKLGIKVKMAGQGNPDQFELISNPNIEFIGSVGVEERKELYKNAKAVLAPTQYYEPFGGVVVEAQASGTPVITTDWGAFTENVQHGKTGYRCRTFHEFLLAVENIINGEIKSEDCRDFAINNYSIHRVKYMYQDFFEKILDVFNGAGWYEIRKREKPLEWLNKFYVT